MQPLAAWPAARRAASLGVLHRHRRHAHHRRRDHRRCAGGARRPARRRPARHSHHRPPGRLERAVRARSGRSTPSWRRTARVAPGRDDGRRQLRKLYQQDDAARRRQLRAHAAGARSASLREVPGAALVARQRRPRDRHRDRPQRVRAPLPPDAVERVVALMRERRHERHRELDPRQWLVRRARQAGGRALDRARAARPRPRQPSSTAGSTSATRPTTC